MLKFAFLEKGQLEKIYELTYKYGWLMREYEDKGWLPDSGYMAFNKVQSELESVIDEDLQGMLDTYEWWLNAHQKDTWIESYKENTISDMVYSLTHWLEFNVDEVTTKLIADNIDVTQEVLNDIDYYKESLAEPYLYYIVSNANYYDSKFGEGFSANVKERMDVDYHDEVLKELIDEHGDELEDNFVGWVSSEYFDKYSMAETYYENDPESWVDRYQDEILELAYQHYLHKFSRAARPDGKSLKEEIEDVREMRDELLGFEDLTLDEKVILFQKGLTTSHHHGTMADHLLEVNMGEGKEFLDELSDSPEAEEWNRWLTKVLGHPLGEREETPEYFQPA